MSATFEALSLIFFMSEKSRAEPMGEGGFVIIPGVESIDGARKSLYDGFVFCLEAS